MGKALTERLNTLKARQVIRGRDESRPYRFICNNSAALRRARRQFVDVVPVELEPDELLLVEDGVPVVVVVEAGGVSTRGDFGRISPTKPTICAPGISSSP